MINCVLKSPTNSRKTMEKLNSSCSCAVHSRIRVTHSTCTLSTRPHFLEAERGRSTVNRHTSVCYWNLLLLLPLPALQRTAVAVRKFSSSLQMKLLINQCMSGWQIQTTSSSIYTSPSLAPTQAIGSCKSGSFFMLTHYNCGLILVPALQVTRRSGTVLSKCLTTRFIYLKNCFIFHIVSQLYSVYPGWLWCQVCSGWQASNWCSHDCDQSWKV